MIWHALCRFFLHIRTCFMIFVTASAHNSCPQKSVCPVLSFPFLSFLSAAIDETGLLSPLPSYPSLRVSTYGRWFFCHSGARSPVCFLPYCTTVFAATPTNSECREKAKKCREKRAIPSSRSLLAEAFLPLLEQKNRFFRTRS